MKETSAHFVIENFNEFKIKMLNWSQQFNIFCFLDTNNYSFEGAAFECMLAAGCSSSISLDTHDPYISLKKFSDENPGWLFGHFNYPSSSRTKEHGVNIGFDNGFFFVPQILLRLKKNEIIIESHYANPKEIFKIINGHSAVIKKSISTKVVIQSLYSRSEYVEIVTALRKHIQRGNCYEINFCQDFYSGNAVADPLFLYHQLSLFSPNPFAAFYKLNEKYCMCASPERFIKKSGNILISQPIKGTSKRDHENTNIDNENRNYLLTSAKEKSENVMIVDLVRNDMSKICTEGSVFVKELFGIYSFPQVHQMISTVEGTVGADVHWADIIKACFPMGSMTGAPKVRVMELIERYEISERELFSGTIGYVSPGGDFDFNVVIRSLFYNETKKIISFKAGSGITFYSNPEDEYEECMMKAAAILNILQKN